LAVVAEGVNKPIEFSKVSDTIVVCPFTLPAKTNNKATIPDVRRINFFNKFSVGFVAADVLNFTFDELSTRDKKEYNDFMPVAVLVWNFEFVHHYF
jgi:hypothetical protein